MNGDGAGKAKNINSATKSAGREIRTPELREHKLSRLAPYQARLSQLKAIPIP